MLGGIITMTEDQQKYYDFVMQRVKKGKEEEVKALILEGFKQQEQGKLQEYMNKIAPKMIFLIRPECFPEVLKAVKDMKI